MLCRLCITYATTPVTASNIAAFFITRIIKKYRLEDYPSSTLLLASVEICVATSIGQQIDDQWGYSSFIMLCIKWGIALLAIKNYSPSLFDFLRNEYKSHPQLSRNIHK